MSGPITADRLRELLHYDPETGVWTWLARPNRRIRIGDAAGYQSRDGYVRIQVEGSYCSSHRLAWLYMTGKWPSREIDHINLVRNDNRWANLREATSLENKANSPARRTNKSGFKGVSWSKGHRKWIAQISIEGKTRYLGSWHTPERAYIAYIFATWDHHGDFWRVR
jgi:hypothetical protein